MRTFSKAIVGFASAGILIAGLAGCSTTAATTASSSAPSSSSSAAAEEPLASIPSLSGVDTAVLLDADFAAVLGTLGLTPGVVGGATLEEGSLHFPITGGNVDYYDPNGTVRPYVQGTLEHEGSGFSLTAGDTVVELTNFTIAPAPRSSSGTSPSTANQPPRRSRSSTSTAEPSSPSRWTATTPSSPAPPYTSPPTPPAC